MATAVAVRSEKRGGEKKRREKESGKEEEEEEKEGNESIYNITRRRKGVQPT